MSAPSFESFVAQYLRLAVCGTYWGDEGKGKIVDICSEYFDIVVRFSGGENAGHSVNDESKNFAFHLLPSGFARGKTCVLAGGVLLKLQALVAEIAENTPKLSCTAPDVLIDERCPIWTPYHALFEAYIERLRGKDAIGTTGRAMGPLQGFHSMREGVIAAHLRDRRQLMRVVTQLHAILKPCFDKMVDEVPTPASVVDELVALAQSSGILKSIIDTGAYLFDEITKGSKRVLFEGSQATGLDVNAGTWPFTTSTSSTAGGIAAGTLLPPGALSGTLLVMKLFPTRVGGGSMPSELSSREAIQRFADANPELFENGSARAEFLEDRLRHCNTDDATSAELGEYIMVKAREIGVSTGRGRSPGRPDLAWARYAIRVNDPIGCVLNGLDVVSGLEIIEVVTGYRYRGVELAPGIVPVLDLANVEPVIEQWPGWKEDITGAASMNQLPQNARRFIERFEEGLGRSIILIGTGTKRRDVIFREPKARLNAIF
ncbi:MAG: adenylosuccinate synthetase [Patescibacteria group bacterium]|nr:adenylosuccinate synthetase [Patescibacteria group bacterium]